MAKNSIFVSKLDAARRQIEAAIRLWIDEGDPVAIHSLTSAAHRIVLDLLERDGKTTNLFDMDKIPDPKRYKKWLRQAETFFKHAKDDPDDVLEFYPEAIAIHLFDAATGYAALGQRPGHLMGAFLYRVSILYRLVDDASLRSIDKSLTIEDVRKLGNKDFFKIVLKGSAP